MKKFDLYLASAMLLFALAWFFINSIFSSKGEKVLIFKDNAIIDTISLSDEGIHSINDGDNILMTFEIKDSSVNVISADCPDKLCVHQKAISNNSEMIVCLPNKIVLEIDEDASSEPGQNTEENNYDAITK